MDHMCISDTKPSLVILSQTKKIQKFEIDVIKVQKQTKVKRDSVINPQNYKFNQL